MISLSGGRTLPTIRCPAEQHQQRDLGTTHIPTLLPSNLFPTGVTSVTSDNTNAGFIFQDDGGNLFAWGSNHYGNLGVGTSYNTVQTVTAIPMMQNVTAVHMSGSYTAFVTGDGELYMVGYNSEGQLGIPQLTPNEDRVLTPTLANIPGNVVTFRALENVKYAVTDGN